MRLREGDRSGSNHVFQRLTTTPPLHLPGDELSGQARERIRVAAYVRRDQNPGGSPQRMIGWQRFWIDHIKSGFYPGEVRKEIVSDHDRATCHID